MSQRKFEVAFSVVILLMATYWVWEARNLPPRVQLVPWTIGVPVLALAVLQLVASIRALRAPTRSEEAQAAGLPAVGGLDLSSADAVAATATAELAEAEPEVEPELARRRGIQMFLWILGFFASIMLLGFRVGAPLATFLFLHFASHERLRVSLAFTIVTYLFLLAADVSHSVTLSTGMIPQELGLESFDAYLVNPILRLVRGQ
ncbi:MAG TPA: hypothetical protein VHX16_02870 [Chloroflexota bacterium]|nr:hypothetical protein [Chloroflexota bacterium]